SRLYRDREMLPVYHKIVEEFSKIEVERREVVRVGIVGEIFVKFSPLGNNDLEKFLISEGAEPVLPDFTGFALYCVYNMFMDYKLYKMGSKIKAWGAEWVYRYLIRRQKKMIGAIAENGAFAVPTPFDVTAASLKGMIHSGMKMGEGWLLTAEMIELIEHGVKNIVCTQPFGCLPNHIAGKGMMKPLKEKYPDVTLVAIDYDAGATRVNQENRIKLMLVVAKEKLQ
ncbi:MAG: 2-hydroxyglutaryl-CoA dehydratase, partial [Clostridia bacterium]|nr:2-hydroxyglutaryl-CoA dehydratase [Clostridia bacterium]